MYSNTKESRFLEPPPEMEISSICVNVPPEQELDRG